MLCSLFENTQETCIAGLISGKSCASPEHIFFLSFCFIFILWTLSYVTFLDFFPLCLGCWSQNENLNRYVYYTLSSLFYFSTLVFLCPSFCFSYRNCQPHLLTESCHTLLSSSNNTSCLIFV